MPYQSDRNPPLGAITLNGYNLQQAWAKLVQRIRQEKVKFWGAPARTYLVREHTCWIWRCTSRTYARPTAQSSHTCGRSWQLEMHVRHTLTWYLRIGNCIAFRWTCTKAYYLGICVHTYSPNWPYLQWPITRICHGLHPLWQTHVINNTSLQTLEVTRGSRWYLIPDAEL